MSRAKSDAPAPSRVDAPLDAPFAVVGAGAVPEAGGLYVCGAKDGMTGLGDLSFGYYGAQPSLLDITAWSLADR